MNVPSDRRVFLLFFFAVTLLYLSLSPFAISHMGYVREELQASRQLLTAGPASTQWPRNGAVGLLLQLPFVAAGDLLAGSEEGGDRLLAVQPVLASAALVTLIFAWGSRLAGSRSWAFLVAVVAGFGTMLWPYAYIGLETTQSLFLLWTAYLALESRGPRTWPRSLALGLCAAIAVSTKSNGAMLIPAAGFLIWAYFRGEETGSDRPRSLPWQAVSVVALVAAVFGANSYVRYLAWVRFGGALSFVSTVRSTDALSPFLHLVGLVGSPNKGLLVFAPLAILGLLALPRAFMAHRRLAIFTVLTLAGLAGGCALLEVWADETWGPRYLHSAIAPLALCVAAAGPSRRARVALSVAGAFGFAVALLGSLYYYGLLHGVATESTPPTIEALQGDPTWNHVHFNARLLRVWIKHERGIDSGPEYLRRPRPWDYKDSRRAPPWKDFDLRPMMQPQPFLLHPLLSRSSRADRVLHYSCALALIAGAALLASVGLATRGG